jgi:cadmium resistance protein CadD (predicted permease)
VAAGFLEVLGVGIAAFVASNIDDLFILIVFFTKRDFPPSQIILGQYVGMGLLIGLGLVGSLIALVIPHNLIGLVGVFPIAIGIKELIELRKHNDDDSNNADDRHDTTKWQSRRRNRWTTAYLPFLMVATITFSGGEEVGIYTSIFTIYNDLSEIIIIISVVIVLTGVWCGIAAYLVNHTFLANRCRRIADKALPFVLIALGIYVLVEAFLMHSLQS